MCADTHKTTRCGNVIPSLQEHRPSHQESFYNLTCGHIRKQTILSQIFCIQLSSVSGSDYYLTYYTVCKFATLCTLLATAAHEGLSLRNFDVKTAFWHTKMEEEFYMLQPNDFERGELGWVCSLLQAMYGFMQVSRAWFLKFKREPFISTVLFRLKHVCAH